jgi:hemolysin
MTKLSRLTLISLSLFSTLSAYAIEYIPIVDKAVYLTRTNIQCQLYTSGDFEKQRDWCDSGASIDVRVNISQMRSVQGVTPQGNATQNAKIVRFSVDENQGGTGIHLVDNLKQDHSWFQSWANRRTFIGPFAEGYDLWVKPIKGAFIRKVKDFPANKNTNYQNRDTSGYSIGINGSVGAGVDSEGPKLGAEIGGSFTFSQSKTLIYDTQEYSIVNRSSGSDFNLSFERSFDECSELRRQELGCYFSSAHWGSGYVFDKSKFNPIAYANFKPNYDVIYEAPVTEMGTTTFEIGVKARIKVRYGTVLPSAVFSAYGPGGSSSNSISATTQFQIDWSHPLFEPEAHVTLQSLNNNDLCLDVHGVNGNTSVEGGLVSGWSCKGNWNQVWGLDTNGRYKSRVGSDRCLTVQSDMSLAVERCGSNLNQQWYWSGEKLFSRYTDGTSTKYLLALDGGNSIAVKPESEATQARWQPRLKKINL